MKLVFICSLFFWFTFATCALSTIKLNTLRSISSDPLNSPHGNSADEDTDDQEEKQKKDSSPFTCQSLMTPSALAKRPITYFMTALSRPLEFYIDSLSSTHKRTLFRELMQLTGGDGDFDGSLLLDHYGHLFIKSEPKINSYVRKKDDSSVKMLKKLQSYHGTSSSSCSFSDSSILLPLYITLLDDSCSRFWCIYLSDSLFKTTICLKIDINASTEQTSSSRLFSGLIKTITSSAIQNDEACTLTNIPVHLRAFSNPDSFEMMKISFHLSSLPGFGEFMLERTLALSNLALPNGNYYQLKEIPDLTKSCSLQELLDSNAHKHGLLENDSKYESDKSPKSQDSTFVEQLTFKDRAALVIKMIKLIETLHLNTKHVHRNLKATSFIFALENNDFFCLKLAETDFALPGLPTDVKYTKSKASVKNEWDAMVSIVSPQMKIFYHQTWNLAAPEQTLAFKEAKEQFLKPREHSSTSFMHSEADLIWKSDVWALGALIHQIITKYPLPLFESITDLTPSLLFQRSFQYLNKEIDLIGLELINKNKDLTEMLKGMLAADPRDRWTMKQVVECKWFKEHLTEDKHLNEIIKALIQAKIKVIPTPQSSTGPVINPSIKSIDKNSTKDSESSAPLCPLTFSPLEFPLSNPLLQEISFALRDTPLPFDIRQARLISQLSNKHLYLGKLHARHPVIKEKDVRSLPLPSASLISSPFEPEIDLSADAMLQPGQLVAVKRYTKMDQEADLKNFCRAIKNARYLSSLGSPFVVTTYKASPVFKSHDNHAPSEVLLLNKQPITDEMWEVEEALGINLQELCDDPEARRLLNSNYRDRELLALQIFDILIFLHVTAGMVHKDLKPHNFCFAASFLDERTDLARASFENLKLIDFESCELVPRTEQGKFVPFTAYPSHHTWSYKAPEDICVDVYKTPDYVCQSLFRRRVNLWESDVWAMGCILHQICTGHPLPFIPDTKNLTPEVLAASCWQYTTGYTGLLFTIVGSLNKEVIVPFPLWLIIKGMLDPWPDQRLRATDIMKTEWYKEQSMSSNDKLSHSLSQRIKELSLKKLGVMAHRK